MRKGPIKILSWVTLVALFAGLLVSVTVVAASGPKKNHKVFVAFGFHINLYHSFRNDTNDEYEIGSPRLSLNLELKIFWANISAFLSR